MDGNWRGCSGGEGSGKLDVGCHGVPIRVGRNVEEGFPDFGGGAVDRGMAVKGNSACGGVVRGG